MGELIIRVDLKRLDSNLLRQWAECYCEIWKEEPWCEDFWQPEGVIEDIRNQMSEPDARAFLALSEDRVAGFTLGYSVTPTKLQSIAGHDLLEYLFHKHSRIFYVAELGVAAKYRGRRISLRLTSELLKTAWGVGCDAVVLRTDMRAHVARHVYERQSFVDLKIQDAAHPNRTYWILENRQQ